MLACGCSRQFSAPAVIADAGQPPTLEQAVPARAFAGQVVLLHGAHLAPRADDNSVRFGTALASLAPDAGGDPDVLPVVVPDLGADAADGIAVTLTAGGEVASLAGGFSYRGPGHVSALDVQPVSDLSPRPGALAVEDPLFAYWMARSNQLLVDTNGIHVAVAPPPGFVPTSSDAATTAEGIRGWFYAPADGGGTDVVAIFVGDAGVTASTQSIAAGTQVRGFPQATVAVGPLAQQIDGAVPIATTQPVLWTSKVPDPTLTGAFDLGVVLANPDGGAMGLQVFRLEVDAGVTPVSTDDAPELVGLNVRAASLAPDLSQWDFECDDPAFVNREILMRHALAASAGASELFDRTHDATGKLVATWDGVFYSADPPFHLEEDDFSGLRLTDAITDPISDFSLDLNYVSYVGAVHLSPPRISFYNLTGIFGTDEPLVAGIQTASFSPSSTRAAVVTHYPAGVAVVDASTLISDSSASFLSGAEPLSTIPAGAIGDLRWIDDTLACATTAAGVRCAAPDALLRSDACPVLGGQLEPAAGVELASDGRGTLLVVNRAQIWSCTRGDGCAMTCTPASFDAPPSTGVGAVEVSEDLQAVVVGANGDQGPSLTLLRPGEAGQHVDVPGESMAGLALSPDGRRCVTVGTPALVAVVDLDSAQVVAQLDVLGGNPTSEAFSADGQRLYVGLDTHFLLEFDVSDFEGASGPVLPRRSVPTSFEVDGIRSLPTGGKLLLFSTYNIQGDLLWEVQ
ncbi:MAG: hypothetical protein JST54_16555 [Deltaproteobacteria bacterium]|nr:hypothetical protein [Deltaproteobacteria bacterium]